MTTLLTCTSALRVQLLRALCVVGGELAWTEAEPYLGRALYTSACCHSGHGVPRSNAVPQHHSDRAAFPGHSRSFALDLRAKSTTERLETDPQDAVRSRVPAERAACSAARIPLMETSEEALMFVLRWVRPPFFTHELVL